MAEQPTRMMQLQNTVLNMITAERVSGKKWSISKMARETKVSEGHVMLHEQHKYFDVGYICSALRKLEIPHSEVLKLAKTQGEKVRVARWTIGLTQADLARELHVPATALSNIELGKKAIEETLGLEIETLAKALFVSSDWLKSEKPKAKQTEMKLSTADKEERAKKDDKENKETSISLMVRREIGKIMRGQREEQGLSTADLSKKTGISAPVIEAAERGEAIGCSSIPYIAKALNIDHGLVLQLFADTPAERVSAAGALSTTTVSEAAKSINVSTTTLLTIKNGERNLYDSEVPALASAFGVSTEWLKTGNGDPIPAKPDDGALAAGKTETTIIKPEGKEKATMDDPVFEVNVSDDSNGGVTFKGMTCEEMVALMNLASKHNLHALAALDK